MEFENEDPPPSLETFLLSKDNIFETFLRYGNNISLSIYVICYFYNNIKLIKQNILKKFQKSFKKFQKVSKKFQKRI